MFVKYINLINFRNYENISIELCEGTNVFIGDNAQGKTNILEALYYSSVGKSHRTNKDKELIKWDSENSFVSTYVAKNRIDKRIDIKFFRDGKKAININSIKITKLQDLVGVLNVVMFSPEDLNIVKDSPSYRRKFLDIELCKLDKKYYYSLASYKKILLERNMILKKYVDNSDFIDIYDIKLAEYGSYIIKRRLEYIQGLNNYSKSIHKDITQGKENIEFKYMMQLKDNSNLQEELYNLLRLNRKKDIEKRVTSIGPHRDDFSILVNNMDVKTFGSQGQQRTSVLTIKFSSLMIIKELIGEYPLLLLDDVLSELDTKRQEYILKSIDGIQTLITGTGFIDIKKYIKNENIQIFNVEKGKVFKIN